MVPVACAVPIVVTTAAEFEAFCSVSVKVSLASLVVSPATVTVTIAEVWPAAMVPLKAIGLPPTKSAASVCAEAIAPEKVTSPVVPPVRSTVN